MEQLNMGNYKWWMSFKERQFIEGLNEVIKFIQDNDRWPTKNENKFIVNKRTALKNNKLTSYQADLLTETLGKGWEAARATSPMEKGTAFSIM